MTQRLLVIGDAGMNTGFERVVRGIAGHLHARGDYDVTVRGLGYDPATSPRTYPWTVKPVGGTFDDPMGVFRVQEWLAEDRPDLLLVVHDLWQWSNYSVRLPRDLPATVYFPVDCPNLRWDYGLSLGGAAQAVAYTQYGRDEAIAAVQDASRLLADAHAGDAEALHARAQWLTLPTQVSGDFTFRPDRLRRYADPAYWSVLPHGQEPGAFAPQDKAAARAAWGFPRDAYVVGNVSTNSERKRLDRMIRAFRLVLDRRPDALLVLHCQGGDSAGGWDLAQLCRYYGVAERTVCTHLAVPELTEAQLAQLYNTFDVFVNSSAGEGWGLPAFEAAACGVPVVVPDWSATRELWQGYGALVPVSDWVHRTGRINTAHALVSIPALADTLLNLAESPGTWETMAGLALDNARRQLTWDEVGEGFHHVLQVAGHEPAPEPVSLADLRDAVAAADRRSELAGRPTMLHVGA